MLPPCDLGWVAAEEAEAARSTYRSDKEEKRLSLPLHQKIQKELDTEQMKALQGGRRFWRKFWAAEQRMNRQEEAAEQRMKRQEEAAKQPTKRQRRGEPIICALCGPEDDSGGCMTCVIVRERRRGGVY